MATATSKTVAGIAAITHICGDISEHEDQAPETDSADDKLGLSVSQLSGSGRPDFTNQVTALRNSPETKRILWELSVPFAELEDLSDFIQAHQAAQLELDRDLPDAWQNPQGSIQSRNWIRHRSQSKLDDAIELAAQYLTDVDCSVKIVMFAMDIETIFGFEPNV